MNDFRYETTLSCYNIDIIVIEVLYLFYYFFLFGILSRLFYFFNLSATGAVDCNFDTDICAWTQDLSDNFNWSRNKGTTGSANTGPQADHTSGSKHSSLSYLRAVITLLGIVAMGLK